MKILLIKEKVKQILNDNTIKLSEVKDTVNDALRMLGRETLKKIINENGENIFLLAARKGWIEIINLLVANEKKMLISNSKDKYGQNAFILSAKYGNLKLLLRLYELNPDDINAYDNNKNCVFIHAIINGHADIIEKLLLIELNLINSCDAEGNNALLVAAKREQWNIVEKLLSYESNPKIHTNLGKQDVLLLAVINGKLDIVNNLLEKDEDLINTLDAEGKNVLALAVIHNHWDIVEKLLSYQSNPINRINISKQEALLLAVKNGKLDIVKNLLEKDEDLINTCDANGVNLVLLAVKYKQYRCVHFLYEYPALRALINYEAVFDEENPDDSKPTTPRSAKIAEEFDKKAERLVEIMQRTISGNSVIINTDALKLKQSNTAESDKEGKLRVENPLLPRKRGLSKSDSVYERKKRPTSIDNDDVVGKMETLICKPRIISSLVAFSTLSIIYISSNIPDPYLIIPFTFVSATIIAIGYTAYTYSESLINFANNFNIFESDFKSKITVDYEQQMFIS